LLTFRPAIIGTAVIYSIPPTHHTRIGLLIAFYCTQFYLAEGNLIFALISRNVAGQTKKSTTLAMTFVAWAAGNMTAPQVSCRHFHRALLTFRSSNLPMRRDTERGSLLISAFTFSSILS
jgi:hypothetical protein